MNGRAAKIFRKIAREQAKKLEAPDRALFQHPNSPGTAINHPATARAITKALKKAYHKGLKS